MGRYEGHRPVPKLTDRTVKTAGPGRYSDGTVRGLMLVVRDSGSRAWVLRYQISGRRRDMGLGPYPEIGLADAREMALDARRLIKRDRKDPISERGRAKGLSFKSAAGALIESRRPGWRNAKHAEQWSSTLETYAYPKLGILDVQAIDTAAVLDVLRPIWTTKTETASGCVSASKPFWTTLLQSRLVPTTTLPAGGDILTTFCPGRPEYASSGTMLLWTGARHRPSWPSLRNGRALMLAPLRSRSSPLPAQARCDRAARRARRARRSGLPEPGQGRETTLGCRACGRARAYGLRQHHRSWLSLDVP